MPVNITAILPVNTTQHWAHAPHFSCQQCLLIRSPLLCWHLYCSSFSLSVCWAQSSSSRNFGLKWGDEFWPLCASQPPAIGEPALWFLSITACFSLHWAIVTLLLTSKPTLPTPSLNSGLGFPGNKLWAKFYQLGRGEMVRAAIVTWPHAVFLEQRWFSCRFFLPPWVFKPPCCSCTWEGSEGCAPQWKEEVPLPCLK